MSRQQESFVSVENKARIYLARKSILANSARIVCEPLENKTLRQD